MKKNISFIAIGQAGGNIGQLLEQREFEVLYLNTSLEDLDTLSNVKYKYHIKGGEGANKDREKAKKLIIQDFRNVEREIKEKITNNIIFLIFAAGGGTGSGVSPALMRLLINQTNKTVGGITVLPAENESIKAHINTYECFREMEEIKESAALFVIDNKSGEKLKLNREFAKDFCNFIVIPDKYKDKRGNIDTAEIKESLTSHGMALLININSQNKASAADIIKKIKNNIYAPLEKDKVIKYITAAIPSNIDIAATEKEIGIPLDNFITYTQKEVILCLSGLSMPFERLENILNKIENNKENILKNLKKTKEKILSEKVNFLEELEKTVPEENKTGKQVLEDFFKF